MIAHRARSLLRFRGGLLRELAKRRHRVLALVPDLDDSARAELDAHDIAAASFPLEPPGSGPFAERRTERAIADHLRQFAPHIVVASGPRTASLGVTLGKAAGAARIVLIVNGLAALGADGSDAGGWLREANTRRRRKATIAGASVVVFHNPDDPRTLIADDLMPAGKPHIVTAGSGIDLARFAEAPLPPFGDGLAFLMLARLDPAQGVATFAEAASRVKEKAPGARFLVAGPEGSPPDGLTAASLARYKGAVEYLGDVADVRPLIAAAHVLVHPSLSEGLPGALLEGLAMGRPLIASDIPGSRTTIDERVNGVLVPAGRAEELATAIQSFLKRPDLIPAMARASRAKAERLFDERTVIAQMIEAMQLG